MLKKIKPHYPMYYDIAIQTDMISERNIIHEFVSILSELYVKQNFRAFIIESEFKQIPEMIRRPGAKIAE